MFYLQGSQTHSYPDIRPDWFYTLLNLQGSQTHLNALNNVKIVLHSS